MTWQRLRIIGPRVLVRIDQRAGMSGTIIIPDTAKKQPEWGTVIAAGPGGYDEKGQWYDVDVKAGDRVVFGKWNGIRIEAPEDDPRGEYYVMNCAKDLRVQDIYGVEER